MALSLIGTKLGMTKVYTDKGEAVAVTVVEVKGNTVVQVKKKSEKDGYNAVQVAYSEQKEQRLTKPALGHFKKYGVSPKRIIKEFLIEGEENLPAPATELSADMFSVGQYVDVIGTSKGKGFQGVVKRWNFAGQPQTHGSMMHRRPGSIGCRLTPGLVWKNQKMPGHDGVDRVTTQNLKVIQSRPEDGVLLISGAIPGNKGSIVVVRPAKKKSAAK
jgi:large subunit ribosomal protein L3